MNKIVLILLILFISISSFLGGFLLRDLYLDNRIKNELTSHEGRIVALENMHRHTKH